MIDHTPRAACRAMAARKRSVALLSVCRRCRPARNEPPCMYSITDETVPCSSMHHIRGLCADATCQQCQMQYCRGQRHQGEAVCRNRNQRTSGYLDPLTSEFQQNVGCGGEHPHHCSSVNLMVLAVQHLVLQYAKEGDDAGMAQTGQRLRFCKHVCTRLRPRCASFYALLTKGNTIRLGHIIDM